jgi:predicted phosphohydrolase
MTRFQIMSDLHFEFHADHGREFVAKLDPAGVDALILAGDVCPAGRLAEALRRFCDKYPRVFYVVGNHEFYGYSRTEVERAIDQVSRARANLAVLDEGRVHEAGGRRVLGCALWFPDDPSNARYEHLLNDFSHVPRFRDWIYATNERHVAWLRASVRAGDVVVTHHLPSARCVAPRFAGSSLNRFFVCPMDDVLDRGPALWVHGHTHDLIDLVLPSGTRVVCNPFGYATSEVNARFDPRKIVEL